MGVKHCDVIERDFSLARRSLVGFVTLFLCFFSNVVYMNHQTADIFISNERLYIDTYFLEFSGTRLGQWTRDGMLLIRK